MGEKRVVSLLASGTEILAQLGMLHTLVGRSHECDRPESILHLPLLSTPLVDIDASSAEIDNQVRSSLVQGHSIYKIDEEQLRALRPNLIITQSHCEVCAVSPRDLIGYLKIFPENERPEIVSLLPNTLDDLWSDIRQVAAALQAGVRGEQLIASLQARLQLLRDACAAISRPRLLVLEWTDPLMGAGSWMPELVELAGGVLIGGVKGAHSPTIPFADLPSLDPDVIVITPCGFDLHRAKKEHRALASRPGWGTLRAVQSGRVFVADGNLYFNRSGPRLIESAEILAEILHPDRFSFGHPAWEPAITG